MNKHICYGVWRHIWRHMTRAWARSILVILVVFALLLTLGWLQETISRNEIEINRLFETTHVFGQIVPSDPNIVVQHREAGDVITRQTLDEIATSGLVEDIYFESSSPWALVTSPNDDGTFPVEVLDEFAGYGNVFDAWNHRENLNELIAVDQLESFNARNLSTVQFAPELNYDDFVYTDESLETAIPVILSEQTMMRNGFAFGDIVSIGYRLNRDPALWEEMTATIIGIHNGMDLDRTILLPLSAWEFAPGDIIGFTTLQFMIDPALNRELPAVREKIEEIITQSGAGFTSLMLDLQDEELRLVVQPMEENVSLLWLLYPVVIVVSMMIATGLAFFLTLQNAKNVAIMRIFGATPRRISTILGVEQVVLCLSGLVLGLCFLTVLSWGFGVLELFGIAGLYLLSVMIGSAFGIFLITRHASLELLQVKE